MGLTSSQWMETISSLVITIALGAYFSALQLLEYLMASFSIRDGVYGSTFYLATGFHGLHVLIGSIFLAVSAYRHYIFHFSQHHHFGFEASAWY